MIEINQKQLILHNGDITKVKADAIVNAANSSLMGGGGVDGAIHRAGGKEILEECKKIIYRIGKLPAGEAVITTAGNLPSKFVIHTVGPVWRGGNMNEDEILRNAYKNSLTLASDYKLKSVAFPSISTGVYRFPIQLASEIAISTILDFLQKDSSITKVTMVLFSKNNYDIFNNTLNYFKKKRSCR